MKQDSDRHPHAFKEEMVDQDAKRIIDYIAV